MECRIFRPDKNGDLQHVRTVTPEQIFKKVLSREGLSTLQRDIKQLRLGKTIPARKSTVRPSRYRYVHATTHSVAKPYRANISTTIKGKRCGKYFGDFSTDLEGAQVIAEYLNCNVQDLLKRESIKKVSAPSRYRCVHVDQRSGSNPYVAQVRIKPAGIKRLGSFATDLEAAQAVAKFKGCTVEDLRK